MPSPLAAPYELRIDASVLAPGGRFVQRSDRHVIRLRADLVDAGGANDHRKKLQHFEGCGRKTEGEDVFVASQRMIDRKSLDIRGIIEMPFALSLDKAGIVLTKAGKTPVTRPGDMRFPFCATHLAISRT
jgi:hypothetical protein